jgi:hypothetical protein
MATSLAKKTTKRIVEVDELKKALETINLTLRLETHQLLNARAQCEAAETKLAAAETRNVALSEDLEQKTRMVAAYRRTASAVTAMLSETAVQLTEDCGTDMLAAPDDRMGPAAMLSEAALQLTEQGEGDMLAAPDDRMGPAAMLSEAVLQLTEEGEGGKSDDRMGPAATLSEAVLQLTEEGEGGKSDENADPMIVRMHKNHMCCRRPKVYQGRNNHAGFDTPTGGQAEFIIDPTTAGVQVELQLLHHAVIRLQDNDQVYKTLVVDEISFLLSDLGDRAACKRAWESKKERPHMSKNGVFQVFCSHEGFVLSSVTPVAHGQQAKGNRGGGPDVPNDYFFSVKLSRTERPAFSPIGLRYVFEYGIPDELRPACSHVGVFSVGAAWKSGCTSSKRKIPPILAFCEDDSELSGPPAKTWRCTNYLGMVSDGRGGWERRMSTRSASSGGVSQAADAAAYRTYGLSTYGISDREFEDSIEQHEMEKEPIYGPEPVDKRASFE